ncbi:MAG: YicC/YloC family endoribonuclease [Nevskiales bacterium]
MTGFARLDLSGPWRELSWELRSVNSRYLDLHLHLADELRFLEPEIRSLIPEQVTRGKLNLQLRYAGPQAAQAALDPDAERLRQLAAAAEVLTRAGFKLAPMDPIAVLNWPGVLREEHPDYAALREPALQGLREALAVLVKHRSDEGLRLADFLRSRGQRIGELLRQVQSRLPALREELRAKLMARLKEAVAALGAVPDAGRVEQELALVAQRQDVDEELSRLASHITELEATLKRPEPVGRRLDFLMQEFNREANTLGSKSQDPELTRVAVELKVLIEQMREQVQNIE